MFASWVIVVVNDLASLPEQALPLVRQSALEPYPELCLVLVHGGGGLKGKALIDALKKAKVTRIAADPVKAWELPKFVAAEAKSLRMGMDVQAASRTSSMQWEPICVRSPVRCASWRPTIRGSS